MSINNTTHRNILFMTKMSDIVTKSRITELYHPKISQQCTRSKLFPRMHAFVHSEEIPDKTLETDIFVCKKHKYS